MTSILEQNVVDVLDYLDYNYGTKDVDFSVSFINTPTGNIILKPNEIENPLFVSENGGNVLKMSYKEICNFGHVYVICMRDNYEDIPDLYSNSYDRVINKTNCLKLSSNYAFLKTSLKLLDEVHYKRCANVVSRKLLVSLYGMDDSKLENEEIIVTMFELNESVAKMNLAMYDTQYGITDVSKFLSLTQFYNKKSHKYVVKHLSEHLGNLRESQFWCNMYNCNINATKKFKRRGFATSNKKQIAQNSNEEDKSLNTLKHKKITDLNYVNFEEETQTDPYVDLHSVLKSSKNRTYYMDNPPKTELSKEEITELFKSLKHEQEIYNLFNTLAVSKEYCHTVINNKEVLIQMKPLFEKYAPVYKLIFGYAWLSFVLEEYIMKSKTTIDHRFVFDLDTAQHLPFFPYSFDDLHQNPYIVLPVDLNVVNANQNAMSLFCIDNFDGYGVCSEETFLSRINLLTTGNSKQNIFDGIDGKSFAITGSCITACIQKKSPLFFNIEKQTNNSETSTLEFFNNYYAESDIDLMCNESSIFGFTEKAEIAIKQIQKNTIGYKEGDIVVDPVKSLYICLSKNFFVLKCDEINETLRTAYTPDQLIELCDSQEFKEYLYPIYVINKQKSNSSIRKSGKQINDYMLQFMNYASVKDIKIDIIKEGRAENAFDSDINLYMNDFLSKNEHVAKEQNVLTMKICEGIKFKISSQKLRKPIELFRCKTNDFFGVVGKFHLPCVRSYETCSKVYLMPTTITAMMTGINLDYRYFVGIKNQFDILNKYNTRGFGTILTSNELSEMIEYFKNGKSENEIFTLKSNSKEELEKLFGGKELSHKIYRPTKNVNSKSYVYSDVSHIKYIKSVNDIREYYRKKCGYSAENFGIDMMQFKTYSPDGNVNPYVPSISKMYYEIANIKKRQNVENDKQKKIVIEKISKHA